MRASAAFPRFSRPGRGSHDAALRFGTNCLSVRSFRTTTPIVDVNDVRGQPVSRENSVKVISALKGSAQLSSRLRKSPYYEATLRYGVQEFTVYNRMLMPISFIGISAEADYTALVEHASVWDVAAERQVELQGPDAHRLAQLLTCRDITNLKKRIRHYVRRGWHRYQRSCVSARR